MKIIQSWIFVCILFIFECTKGYKLVCYYDISSPTKLSGIQFTDRHMELALTFCTHVVYSYVSLSHQDFTIKALKPEHEIELVKVKNFKEKYSHVKFLLSIGDGDNKDSTQNFLNFLMTDSETREKFIESTIKVLNKYDFDGLSLDFPIPRVDVKSQNSRSAHMWSFLRKFSIRHSYESRKEMTIRRYKSELTALLKQLRSNLLQDKKMLIFNALPNVDVQNYVDVGEIIHSVDFVILSAFDFYTPENDPNTADLMAPIKTWSKSPLQFTSIDSLYKYWNSMDVPNEKIVIGVATWGHSWIINNRYKTNGIPPVMYVADGPGPAGPRSFISGFVSWPEMCQILANDSLLQTIRSPDEKFGVYSFRPPTNDRKGIWISYEDPKTVTAKASYVRRNCLGGVALFSLNFDDINGDCNEEKFPLLRSVKHAMNIIPTF